MAKENQAAAEEEESLKPTPELNPRNDFMADLAKRNRGERDENLAANNIEVANTSGGDVDSDDEDYDQTREEKEQAKLHQKQQFPSPAKKEQQQRQETQPVDLGDENLVTLVVDGKETQVSRDKVFEVGQRAIQKQMAADKALEDANRMKREAQELLDKAQSGDKQHDDVDLNDKLSDIADRIQLGSKEDGIAALQEFAKILGVDKQSKVDMNALREQITSDIRERTDFEKATEYVNAEFSDVLSDDIYRNEFVRREQEARNSGDDRSYMDLYKAIATDLRNHKQGQSPTKTAGLDERRRQKRESSAPPGGHSTPSANNTSTREPPRPKTQQEKITEMRASRGQG